MVFGMINYNLASLGETSLMIWAIVFYFAIMFAFVLGNFIAVKVLSPQFKNVGRMFYCALIWFCTHIVISLFLNPISDPFRIWLIIALSIIAFYFEIKFLFDYNWAKAIWATLIVCAVGDIIFFILYFIWPFVADKLVTLPFNI